MQASVYLSRRVPDAVRAELEARFALDLNDSERPVERDAFLAAAEGRAGLVTMLTDRVDDELFDVAGSGLRIVSNYAVGYDNVDVDAASSRGIVVSNTPEVLTEATAELAMALILAAARRVCEGDCFIRRREPWIWAPTFMLGAGLRDAVLGVVGLGRIGGELARLAEAFGMRVLYTNRSGSHDGRYERVELRELLSRADVVSLHCPLTEETRHLIGRDELRAMRRDAILVNTTRGAVVDEAALAAALRAGEIGAAALDVFEREPEVSDDLLPLENVVLVPHLGSATRETREAMGMLCVSALDDVLLQNRCPRNAVNPDVWSAAR